MELVEEKDLSRGHTTCPPSEAVMFFRGRGLCNLEINFTSGPTSSTACRLGTLRKLCYSHCLQQIKILTKVKQINTQLKMILISQQGFSVVLYESVITYNWVL